MAKPPRTDKPGPAASLDAVLDGFESFVGSVSELAAQAAPAESELQVLMLATREDVVSQTGKVVAFTRQMAGRLSPSQSLELDEFLQVQDGPAMARRGIATAQRAMAGGKGRRIVVWIGQHLREIKKIIDAILRFIFERLGKPYPSWVGKLFLLIDELWNLLMSFLAEVYGLDFRATSNELSDAEVSYLNELAAYERLNAVRPIAGATFHDP